jgi:asparagine synthase (glutamine-hydrolysing)
MSELNIQKLVMKSRRLFSKIDFEIFSIRNTEMASIIEAIISQGLSYLEKQTIYDLVKIAIDNERRGVEGIIVEAGCALGGSAIAIASAKSKERPFFIYDVFGTIPPPSEQDGIDAQNRYQIIASGNADGIGGEKYYGYENDLYAKVIDSFRKFSIEPQENNIHFVKGLYENTMQIEQPVSFAHIDCDWYDSVMCCLNQIEPYLSSGGTLVIDDYYHYSGCKKAVDLYFRNKKNDYKFYRKNRLHIVKI